MDHAKPSRRPSEIRQMPELSKMTATTAIVCSPWITRALQRGWHGRCARAFESLNMPKVLRLACQFAYTQSLHWQAVLPFSDSL